jgi:acetyl-CoA synthetase
LHFVGRDDDIITSSGYRIGPGEIEECLVRHPAVRLAAAIGRPDPLRTEIVVAFVVPAPGYEPSDCARGRHPAFSCATTCPPTNTRGNSSSGASCL